MIQIITVRALIQQEGKILLLKRFGGNPQFQDLYELPGGKVAFGEDPTAALRREVTEETGLTATNLQLAETYSHIDKTDPQKQYISLVFWVSVADTQRVALDSEHNKYIWKKLSDIQPDEITDFTRTELALGSSAVPKHVEAPVGKEVSQNAKVIVYTDGGSRGNPGPSASGFVIKDQDERLLFEGGKYVGITTNNQAEYQAVKLALEKALEIGAREVQFRLDSELVVNQLNGQYQIKNRDLWPIHETIKELIKQFTHVSFVHVRRELNTEADAMVNHILDTSHTRT